MQKQHVGNIVVGDMKLTGINVHHGNPTAAHEPNAVNA
jgi:hypothetical protein